MAPPPQDIELNPFGTYKIKEESLTHGSSYSMREPNYEESKEPRMERIINSFRRDPNSKFFPSRDLDDIGPLESVRRHNNGSPFYDLRRAALATANSNGLSRKLKGRHLQMIAIGGSIGAHTFYRRSHVVVKLLNQSTTIPLLSLLTPLQAPACSWHLVRRLPREVLRLCSLPFPSSVLCCIAHVRR